MYQEVLFRKQNDSGFEYLTGNDRNRTRENLKSYKKTAFEGKADCLLGSEKHIKLRNNSRIGELVGNQNEGHFFKEANKSAFMLRRKTREIEQIAGRRVDTLT